MTRVDPHRALLRALAGAYPGLEVLKSRSEPWVSATFLGERHVLHVQGADLSGIEDEEFDLRGHFVADIVWRVEGPAARIEALTIEAA